VRKFGQMMKKEVKGLTPLAMQRLMLHTWPGNVRELENTVEYGVALTQQDVITEDFILQTQTDVSQQPLTPLKEAKDAFERNYLVRLLQLCEGNVSKAAALAGKYRADFYDLLKKHNISKAGYKKSEREA